jgi:hypothetical protein
MIKVIMDFAMQFSPSSVMISSGLGGDIRNGLFGSDSSAGVEDSAVDFGISNLKTLSFVSSF